MNNKKWASSSTISNNNNNPQTIYLLKSFSEHPYGRFGTRRYDESIGATTTRSSSAPSSSPAAPSSSSSGSVNNIMQVFLRKLRKKFRKEKKVFGSNRVIVPYNYYTYAKNFEDKDSALAEPDIFARSFSSRFVASPGMLKRVQSVR